MLARLWAWIRRAVGLKPRCSHGETKQKYWRPGSLPRVQFYEYCVLCGEITKELGWGPAPPAAALAGLADDMNAQREVIASRAIYLDRPWLEAADAYLDLLARARLLARWLSGDPLGEEERHQFEDLMARAKGEGEGAEVSGV